MADFGDNFDQNEVDPAAEFLAREQSELGGIIDEDIRQPAFQVNGDGAPVIDVLKENSGSSFEMIDGLEHEGTGGPVESHSDNFFDGTFENELSADPSQYYGNDFGREVSPSPPLQREVREEPEKIKKWREDQIKRLEDKDKDEEVKKEEWRQIAKKELEDWYKNHEETIAKTKAANRNAEKQFVADDNEIEPGTEWERIAKLCDFNPKAKQGSKDVSRMRSMILQLKQTPLPMSSA